MSESPTPFMAALLRMHARGITRISANCLANEMWPDARHINANGQSFNLAAGIAGRLLRKNRGCHEVQNRVWEIVPEFLSPNNAAAAQPAGTPLPAHSSTPWIPTSKNQPAGSSGTPAASTAAPIRTTRGSSTSI